MRRYIEKYEKEGKGEKKGERKVRHARKRNEVEMRPVSPGGGEPGAGDRIAGFPAQLPR